MFKLLLVVVALATLANAQMSLEARIAESSNQLAKKYCPLRNLKGELFCPFHRGQSLNAPKSSVVMSGTGFDRVKKEVKFPVLATNPSYSRTKRVDTSSNIFNSVNQFVQYVFKAQKAQDVWEAGIYAQQVSEITRLAKSFSLSYTKVGVTQQLYTSFTSNVKSRTPLPEFTQIVNSLPAWNPKDSASTSMYNMLITFYGTDVSLSTQHGGSVYQQTTVKECYGGNLKQGMKVDIESKIKNKSPPNGSGYARYRKLGVFNVLGGNPELGANQMSKRIASFDKAPAAVKFTTVPIWSLISNAQRKNWVKAAIDSYIAKNQPSANKIINDITTAKRRQFLGPLKVYSMSFQKEQANKFVVRYNACPVARPKGSEYTTNCVVTYQPFMLAINKRQKYQAAFGNNQVFVERNGNGQVRLQTVQAGKVKFTSNWITKGCTRVRFGPRVCKKYKGKWWRRSKTYCVDADKFMFRDVCIDCVPTSKHTGKGRYNLPHTMPECHCAGF
eukprot:gene6910-11073_t